MVEAMDLPDYVTNVESISRGLDKFRLKNQLLSEIRNRRGRIHVLELGCGRGAMLLELRKAFPKKLVLYGLNLNEHHGVSKREDFIQNAEDLGIALRTTGKESLPYIAFGNATQLPFEDCAFDIVISNVAFVHMMNKARVIEEVYRCLKVKGKAFIDLDAYEVKIDQDQLADHYSNLNKQINGEYLPRLLMREKKSYLSLESFLCGKPLKVVIDEGIYHGYDTRHFSLFITKESPVQLCLGLLWLKRDSQRITKLVNGKNPVWYGIVDVYEVGSNR